MTYRSANNRSLRSIANVLGIANVVEGTVRRDGNPIRVTTELVDARKEPDAKSSFIETREGLSRKVKMSPGARLGISLIPAMAARRDRTNAPEG
jgi:hypothetical protein